MSKWNAFQSAHAGQGYSSSQMSAMYHASNSGGGSSSSGSGSSYSSGSSSSYSRSSPSPSYSAPVRSSPAAAPAQSTWNAYQQANAGQGKSRAEISAGYHAAKSSSSQASGPISASATRPVSATTSSSSALASRPVSAAAKSSSASPWNEYQRSQAGKGLSPAQMSAGFQAAKSAGAVKSATTAKPTTPAKSTTPAKKAAPAAKSAEFALTWNEFQRTHAGQGLTKRQMSLLYKNQPDPSTPPSSAPTAKATKPTQSTKPTQPSQPTKPARRANAFNEFQKQYKKDHPDEKRSAGELAQLYRGEQQRRADLEPKAPTQTLRERLRQQTEEMLLGIAMAQEQGFCMEEPDAWRSLVHQLEQEEGNYNRQAFVELHGDAEEYAARDPDSLESCEFIEADRLELTLDDDKRIGVGACGAVYAAVVDGDIPVAVKVVDGIGAKSKQRFEQELLAMMKASAHENVLRVLGYTVLSSDSGRDSFGIIMELMGGGDLAFALHRDEKVKLSERARLQLLLQVIKAIEFIHAQGITHRDLKPHNILLSTDLQTAKLADFGLAGFKNTTLTTQQSQTTTKESGGAMVLGLTPAYAAPEVFEGKLSFRDTAWKESDVFSFTVLLAEVLRQETPWEFESPQFIKHSVTTLQQRPFEPNELTVSGGKTGTPALQALVQDGWSQDPAARPSAAEMRQRLEKIIASVPVGTKASCTTQPRVSSPRGVDGV